MIIVVTVFLVLIANGLTKSIPSDKGRDEKTPFTLEESLSGFTAKTFSFEWISDTEIQYKQKPTNDTIVLNVETNQNQIVFAYDSIKDVIDNINGYELSPDKKYVLISHDLQPVFRRSTKAKYAVYSIEEKSLTKVENDSYLQLVRWGPKGNNLAYVYLNNIYYIPTVSDPLFDGQKVQITNSGVPDVVFNGIPDWVYEEEIASEAVSLWFSPEGDQLMYVEYNDTEVEEMTYIYYGTDDEEFFQYPEPVPFRYPKAGTKNPTVSINHIDLSKPESILDSIVTWDIDRDRILRGLEWINNNEIVVSIGNRTQNETQISVCNVPPKSKNWEDECNVILWEFIFDGWSDLELPMFSKNSSNLFLSIYQDSNGRPGRFNHLTLFRVNGSIGWEQGLTYGNVDDIDIVDWDEENQLIYFRRTDEAVSSRTHLYSIYPVESIGKPTCLTCNLTLPDGSICYSNNAKFSTKFTYVVIICSGPSPYTAILYKNEYPIGNYITIFEDNYELKSKLELKLLPDVVDSRVPIADKFEANVRLLYPPSEIFDPQKKYPLLINVYGGPDSNQVSDSFSVGFQHYLTTNLGIIYGYIDGRGSGRRGRDLVYATYRKFGTAEIEDQIQVTKYLQENNPNVDPNRTAIWGWSYGGYATAKTLETDVDNVFKCGISVAPVTSWLLYDTFYTERYMGLPTKEDNLDNYIKADLLSNVTNIKNKKFYLIHGSGDDNVHYQNSMLFAKKLAENDILFQQQSYADENHGLPGVTRHVYHSMSEFWKNCFDLND